MFTGIVETMGVITNLMKCNDCVAISVTPNRAFDDLSVGDSVSVNGVCVTVTKVTLSHFDVTLVPETLRLTHLVNVQKGDKVNLERSMIATSRIGGHYVQGHIDFLGEIVAIQTDGKEAKWVKISAPTKFNKYIVNKGFITLDGMSITVIEARLRWFSVMFIPHTQQITVVNQYRVGTRVNVEVDILGKYVEKLLRAQIK